MSDVEAPPALVDPLPPVQLGAAPTPRVRWGRATAIHLAAGLIAGFMVPFYLFILRQLSTFSGDGSALAIWTGVSLASALAVTIVGAAIPLLVAWLSWLVVSRHRRGLRREVLAVVIGAIAGSLIPSALPFFLMASAESDWTYYASCIALLGGMPGVAFALWVAAAWRRARTQLMSTEDLA